MATTNLGKVRFHPRGAYSDVTEYSYYDWVTDSGSSYVYINPTPSTGVPITETSHWQLIAEKGIQGPQGETGDPTSSTASDIPTSTAGVSVQDALDEHTSQLAAFANDVFASERKYVLTNVADMAVKLSGYNASPSSSTTIGVGVNAMFDTYTFFASEDTEIYVDTDIEYFAICTGINPQTGFVPSNTSYTLTAESVSRTRKSENNLPTLASPQTVASGTAFAITVTAGSEPKIYILGDPIQVIKGSFAKEVHEQAIGVKVSRTAETLKLSAPHYEVIFSKIVTTQGYQWNITSLSGGDGKANVLPIGSDIIGVLQFDATLYTTPNFMGGVHGNESTYDFRALSNGAEVEDGKYYDTIHIVMNSHLYDIVATTTNVVDRFVNMVFDACGWESDVTFKVLVDKKIQVAYPSGLFGFNVADASYAACNLGVIDLASTAARRYENAAFREITVNITDNMSVNVMSDTGDIGWVTYRSNTNSFKVYWAKAQLQEVTANTYIAGRCRYKF